MLGVPGIAARAFGAVARTGTSVPMISQASSEQSICFVAPQSAVRASSTPWSTSSIGARAPGHRADLGARRCGGGHGVGSAIQKVPGVAGRVFGAIGDAGVNIIAIAMGSSECSISLAVASADARTALRSVHRLLEG